MYGIQPEAHAWDHYMERIESLFTFDAIRVMQLLESFQYGIGYIFVSFLAGVGVDLLFPNYDENKDTQTLLLEIVLQSILLIFIVFYVRKLVKLVPFLFVLTENGKPIAPQFRPYEGSEYNGEVMIAVILIGSQFNLIKKIDLMSRRLYKWMFNEERKIGISLGL
jgi:hypothetical protein